MDLSSDHAQDFVSNDIDWLRISERGDLTHGFIVKHKDYLLWPVVFSHQKVQDKTIQKCMDSINWKKVSKYSNYTAKTVFDQDVFDYVIKYIGSKLPDPNHLYPDNFIDTYNDKFDWKSLCGSHYLSESIMLKYKDKIDWPTAFRIQKLSEKIMEELIGLKILDSRYSEDIIKNQILSEEFICKHESIFISSRFDYELIAMCQNVSDEFLEKHNVVFSALNNNNRINNKEFVNKCRDDSQVYDITPDLEYKDNFYCHTHYIINHADCDLKTIDRYIDETCRYLNKMHPWYIEIEE